MSLYFCFCVNFCGYIWIGSLFYVSDYQLLTKIKVDGQNLKVMSQFKYLGSTISKEGKRIEITSNASQTMAAAVKLWAIHHQEEKVENDMIKS